MHKIKNLLATVLLLAVAAGFGFAQASLTGDEVMTNVYERPQPNDTEGSLTMTLTNARGAERVRSVRQYIGKYDDAEKKLLFFTAPADVRGTAFMNWSYTDPTKPDDQWIYLPALRRVRRISAEKKNDSFMGSDFTYEDLSARHPDLDVHSVIGTETIDGRRVYVVQSIPSAGSSAYDRTVSWIAEGLWIGLRREFYDDSGNLLKTLEIDRYSRIDGFWTIERMTMRNAQSGHLTTMELSGLEFDTGISESFFSERSMTRGIR